MLTHLIHLRLHGVLTIFHIITITLTLSFMLYFFLILEIISFNVLLLLYYYYYFGIICHLLSLHGTCKSRIPIFFPLENEMRFIHIFDNHDKYCHCYVSWVMLILIIHCNASDFVGWISCIIARNGGGGEGWEKILWRTAGHRGRSRGWASQLRRTQTWSSRARSGRVNKKWKGIKPKSFFDKSYRIEKEIIVIWKVRVSRK